jgi:hypothetical protein
MKRLIALIALVAPLLTSTSASLSTNFVSVNRVLMIDPSSMPVAAGIFQRAYHFAEKQTPAASSQTNMTSLSKRRVATSYREALETVPNRP